MKLIDVEPIIKNLSAMKTQLGYDTIEIDGMIKALREAEEVTAAQQPNNPPTLEELREMDGEPVYDWMGYEWFVVSEVTDDEVIMTDGTIFYIDEDSPNSSDQRFYRRKPEEVGTC